MNRILVLLIILLVVCGITYSQNIFTLDSAITDYSINLVKIVPKGGSIAIIAFETNKESVLNYFYDSMLENIWKQGDITIYERAKIEALVKELDFSLTGRVNDETAQRIGHFAGVGTVIYGSLTKIGDDYLMSIRAATVESGQVLFPKSYDLQLDSRLAGLLGITQSQLSLQDASQIHLQTLESPKSVKSGKSTGLLLGGIGILIIIIAILSGNSSKSKSPGPAGVPIPKISINGGIIGLGLIIGHASD